MEESVKYKVLVHHTADLRLAVRENLTTLGGQLITAQIITPDQDEEIRNTHRSPTDRAADLVRFVQNKVRQNPRHYNTFLGALRSDLSQYSDILTKLEQTRSSVALERQPEIPQPPTPRGGGNQLPAQVSSGTPGDLFVHQNLSTSEAGTGPRLSVSSTTPAKADPYNVQPGLCVIINNTDFKHETSLRLPGEEDEQDLFKLFFSLGFKVKLHRHLTANEMIHKLESYSKREHRGAFFLIILSHGTMVRRREAIVGTDGKTVMVKDIKSFFHISKCSTLREIPKIFLIDFSRGDNTNRLVPRGAGPSSLDTNDYLLVYTSHSTHGSAAYTTDGGSRLTQTFIEVTNEVGDDKTITEIIQEVQVRVQGQQMVKSENRLTHDYFIKRNIRMRGLEELPFEFCAQIEKWITVREETIKEIESIIDDLKLHHRNVNISRITGSSVSIAGSLIAIVGFGLAPVTLGASIGLTVGGIALAVAGGGAVAGSSIVDTIIQKLNVKQAQEQLREDYDQLYTIQVIAKIIDNNVAATGAREECLGVDNKRVVGEVLAQGVIRASTVGMRTAETAVASTLEIGAAALRIGGTAAKSVAAVGLVLNVALIPIDLIEIVRSGVSLAKGSQTKAVEKLKETVEQLQQQLRELKPIVYQQTEDQVQEQD